jgi:hypothetical protein
MSLLGLGDTDIYSARQHTCSVWSSPSNDQRTYNKIEDVVKCHSDVGAVTVFKTVPSRSTSIDLGYVSWEKRLRQSAL